MVAGDLAGEGRHVGVGFPPLGLWSSFLLHCTACCQQGRQALHGARPHARQRCHGGAPYYYSSFTPKETHGHRDPAVPGLTRVKGVIGALPGPEYDLGIFDAVGW